MKLNISNI